MMTGHSPSSPGRNTLARIVPPSRSVIATSFSTSTGWNTTGLPVGFAKPIRLPAEPREGLTFVRYCPFAVQEKTPARHRPGAVKQMRSRPGEPMTRAGERELVGEEQHDGVRVLTLRRPPVNALDRCLVGDILEALRAARGDPECAAVVLTGAPGVFSAGIDMHEVPGYTRLQHADLLRSVNQIGR